MPAPKWWETPEEKFTNGGKPFNPKPTSKTTDKSSSSRKGNNVQASTDTGTRNNTESAYYKFKQAMQEKGITSTQHAILKRYFLNSDAKAQSAIATMPKSVLAVLITNQLNKEKPPKPDLTDEKPSQANPNKGTGNDGGIIAFQSALYSKHISTEDFNWLKEYYEGSSERAKNAVLNLSESTLRSFIKLGKDKEDKKRAEAMADILWREEQDALVYEDRKNGWKPGGENSTKSTNESSNALVYNNLILPNNRLDLIENLENPVFKQITEENPYDQFTEYDELFKDGLPHKVPSNVEEMNENYNYYMRTVLQYQIDELENSGSTIIDGVQGAGFTVRGGAGASGSISVYKVIDEDGNSAFLLSTNAGGMVGAPQVSATLDYLSGKNLDNIYQLKGGSLTNGGSVTTGIANFGTEVVKPFSEGEEIPAYNVYSFGLSTPSPVPVEWHTEAGNTWVISDNVNPSNILKQNKIDELYQQLERYK